MSKKIFLLLFLFVISVNTFGGMAHRLVASMGQSFLNKNALDKIRFLLPPQFKNLSQIASWADEVRNRLPSIHYINADACDEIFQPNYTNIYGAILNYSQQLIDAGSEPTEIIHNGNNLTEAMMFFVHLISDVHQPLHCGMGADRGGNSIYPIYWYTDPTHKKKIEFAFYLGYNIH